MKNVALLTGATAIFAALSVPAFAQTEIATGADAARVTRIDDNITDIEDDVRDAFARSNDPDRFGPADRRSGLFGSMSLSYTAKSGNDESKDLLIAGRVNYNQNQFAQSVGLAIEYGKDSDGNKDTEKTSAIYDAQYYFNDRAYAFGLGRIEVDGMVTDGDDLRRDGFLGFGPGYRIINTPDTAWRVQAGIGVRYTQSGAQYDADESTTETGYIASSRFYHRFNDQVFLTNDTDYLGSKDGDDVITNEFGVNFKMSEQLATKVSYRTEYQEERVERTDNKLGVAIVYGF